MPNRDGTGPAGKGPGTGKVKGRCKKGKQTDQYNNKAGKDRDTVQGRGMQKKRGSRKNR